MFFKGEMMTKMALLNKCNITKKQRIKVNFK